MENPAIQSSPFASTMGIPDFPKRSMYVEYLEDDTELIAKARRKGRKTSANEFRAEYFYGRCDDKRTCIWRNNRHSWKVKSSGTTWVGVHGNDTICMVHMAEDLDVTRVHGFLLFTSKESVLCDFRRSVISEMEDIADPYSKPYELYGKTIKKPFSVVSAVPLSDKVYDASVDDYQESKIVRFRLEYLDKRNRGEVSSDDDYEINKDDEDAKLKRYLKRDRKRERELGIPYTDNDEETVKFLQDKQKRDAAIPVKKTVQESTGECDEKKAIEFLEEEMKKSVKHFTLEETIKTTISAFQHLCNKKFKANEIEVCVMDPDYWVDAEDAYYKDIYVNHLETDEIQKYLPNMSEPECEGS